MPETPYFLMRNGRNQEAERVVSRFFRDDNAREQEVDFIKSAFREEDVQKQLTFCEAFKELINVYPWNLAVGCLIQAF